MPSCVHLNCITKRFARCALSLDLYANFSFCPTVDRSCESEPLESTSQSDLNWGELSCQSYCVLTTTATASRCGN